MEIEITSIFWVVRKLFKFPCAEKSQGISLIDLYFVFANIFLIGQCNVYLWILAGLKKKWSVFCIFESNNFLAVAVSNITRKLVSFLCLTKIVSGQWIHVWTSSLWGGGLIVVEEISPVVELKSDAPLVEVITRVIEEEVKSQLWLSLR